MKTDIRNSIDWRVPNYEAWDKPEHELQVAIVTRSLVFAGDFPEVQLLHAIPNGGFRGMKAGRDLKAEGVLPGIPDLFLPVARDGYHGLYIELKNAKGRVKDDQWEIMQQLYAGGYAVALCNEMRFPLLIIHNYLKGELLHL